MGHWKANSKCPLRIYREGIEHLSLYARKHAFWHGTQWRFKSACASAQSDQSSLSTRRNFAPLAIENALSEDSDQPARMIWIFTGRTCSKVRFLTFRLIPFFSVCAGWSGTRVVRIPVWHKAHFPSTFLHIMRVACVCRYNQGLSWHINAVQSVIARFHTELYYFSSHTCLRLMSSLADKNMRMLSRNQHHF